MNFHVILSALKLIIVHVCYCVNWPFTSSCLSFSVHYTWSKVVIWLTDINNYASTNYHHHIITCVYLSRLCMYRNWKKKKEAEKQVCLKNQTVTKAGTEAHISNRNGSGYKDGVYGKRLKKIDNLKQFRKNLADGP